MIKELLIVILLGISLSETKPNWGNSGKSNKTSSNNGAKNFNKTFNWLEQLEDIKKIGKEVSQSISDGVAVNLGEKFTGEDPCKETYELKLWKKDILDLCFEKNYTTHRCPSCTQLPIEMEFSHVNLIKIDLKEQTITTAFKYRMLWHDDRIVSIDNQSVVVTHAKEGFWMPKVNINQLIKAESYSVSGPVEKMYWREGKMLFIKAGKYETACQMEFENFPFDYQTCTVEFESAEHEPFNLMNLDVKYEKNSAGRLQEYTIQFGKINHNGTVNGSIGMVFYLQRYYQPFLEKYYLPCIGLVLLTSVSFFVPPKMVPGRGGMLVTLFLVLNNIFSASKEETPISKSATALTKYILGCQVFAFLAMMYYGIILFAIRKPMKITERIKEKDPSYNEDPFSRLDKLMFVIYISSFFIYNIAHFSKFLSKMV